jgi:hypothetical protein
LAGSNATGLLSIRFGAWSKSLRTEVDIIFSSRRSSLQILKEGALVRRQRWIPQQLLDICSEHSTLPGIIRVRSD